MNQRNTITENRKDIINIISVLVHLPNFLMQSWILWWKKPLSKVAKLGTNVQLTSSEGQLKLHGYLNFEKNDTISTISLGPLLFYFKGSWGALGWAGSTLGLSFFLFGVDGPGPISSLAMTTQARHSSAQILTFLLNHIPHRYNKQKISWSPNS